MAGILSSFVGASFSTGGASSRTAKTLTTLSSAQVSTTQKRFGTGSLYCSSPSGGTNNPSIQIAGNPVPDDTRWGNYTGYTIEAWVYHTAWQPAGANNTGEGAASVWSMSRQDGYISNCFGFNEAGLITFSYSNSTSYGSQNIQEATASGILNRWQHIAMVKNGTTITLYVDGKSRVSATVSGTPRYDDLGHSSIANRIGSHYWGGTVYIDDFRMSTTARYTDAFVPPPQSFYNDENTVVLIHADGANASTVFTDDVTSTAPLSVAASLNSPTISQTVSGINSADISYLGDDSSSRPVFGYTYLDTVANGQYVKLTLFRVNTDGTTTNGSTYTVDSGGAGTYPTIDSERDGFGLRTSSGFTDYGYLAWIRGSQARMKAFSYDLNAMTATLGTELQVSVTACGQIHMSYIGNSKAMFGYNGGNNANFVQTNWVTRSGTTLTKNATEVSLSGFGQGGGYRSVGMNSPSSTTADGVISVLAAGNNGHGWNISANRINSTSAVGANVTIPETYVYNSNFRVAQLSNSTRFISVGRAQFDAAGFDLQTKALAGTVTWNTGATAPTIAVSSAAERIFWNWTDRFLISEGSTDGEAYVLYVDALDSYRLKYAKLTVSTNTITLGEFQNLDAGTNVDYTLYQNASRFVTVGSDKYWVSALYRNPDATTRFLVVKNPT